MSGLRWRAARLDQVGFLGVVVTTFTSLGCCAPALIAPVAAFFSSIGLWFLVDLRVSVPILYGAVGLILLGLLLSYRRHHRPYAIGLALLGAGAVLFPFHAALDVGLFITLVFGGQALLLAASIVEIVLARHRPRPFYVKPARTVLPHVEGPEIRLSSVLSILLGLLPAL